MECIEVCVGNCLVVKISLGKSLHTHNHISPAESGAHEAQKKHHTSPAESGAHKAQKKHHTSPAESGAHKAQKKHQVLSVNIIILIFGWVKYYCQY